MATAVKTAELVQQGSSVLVHCSDGWYFILLSSPYLYLYCFFILFYFILNSSNYIIYQPEGTGHHRLQACRKCCCQATIARSRASSP